MSLVLVQESHASIFVPEPATAVSIEPQQTTFEAPLQPKVVEPQPSPKEPLVPREDKDFFISAAYSIESGHTSLGYLLKKQPWFLNKERDVKIYLAMAGGYWSSKVSDKTDPSVPHDYTTVYRRQIYNIGIRGDVVYPEGWGYSMGFGHQWETGDITTDFTNDVSIPVFLGTDSRRVGAGKYQSDKFNKNALSFLLGFLYETNTGWKEFNLKFGLDYTYLHYFNNEYVIYTPEGERQTKKLIGYTILPYIAVMF